MAVSPDRKYTRRFVYSLLEGVKGKTLGEIDKSRQFDRTAKSEKITGIAGDVIEQSLFGYARDSRQECDIEIDGVLTELKTTGVRIPKKDLPKVKGKTGVGYNVYLGAKEGISVTGVTLEPTIQTDFNTSHFWEKVEHLLIVFYEYKSYDIVPASKYAEFPIVDYCYNTFSSDERQQLQNDWEIVRDFLKEKYNRYPDPEERRRNLVGFTHLLRPNLLLIELVPGYKKNPGGKSYQKPRYRLKQTFIDYIVRGHFNKSRYKHEIKLEESFSSFAELDIRCHRLSDLYGGKTFRQLKNILGIDTDVTTKNFASEVVVRMFGAEGKKLNEIVDFTRAGIIAKTVTLDLNGRNTEDTKLFHVDFEEWSDRDVDFEDSVAYRYFCEHSFLCPIFCEVEKNNPAEITFQGFKRFALDEDFIESEVKRTWEESRNLIHRNELVWEYEYRNGEPVINKSGSYKGAPNLPKSDSYSVFFRGGGADSSDKNRTECVNHIKMLPQFIWIKGTYIADKLKSLPFL